MASPQRWVGVGASQDSDALTAGGAAVADALAGRDDARLAIAFFSESLDAEAMVAGMNAALPADCELIGCSTAGEIAAAGPGTSGVVVTVLGGAFDVATSVGHQSAEQTRAAGHAAAACFEDLPGGRPHHAVVVLSDGLAGDQEEVVRGLYERLGAGVPLVGGCAGDDLRMEQTVQVHNDRVLRESVVAAAIASDAPLGIGVEHGWRRVGEPMVVTESTGTVVHRLEGRPALDVYLERLDADPAIADDATALTRFAMTHPLGVVRRNREEIRFVSGVDPEARTLTCIANVPQGGQAWLMEGDDSSVLAATDDACREAIAQLGGRAPLGLLAFDCIARNQVLGAGVVDEVSRIAEHADGAAVAGFYTYGEIARVRGSRGFHNQTLVVFAVA